MTRWWPGSARPPSQRCANRSPRRCSTRASRWASWAVPRRRPGSTTRWWPGSARPPSQHCASRSPRRCSTRASRWAQLGRSEEAVAVYDQVVARFGEATEPALREQVAKALVNKGISARPAGPRGRGEMPVYDEVVARFGEATEPALREQVARALFNKGVALASWAFRGGGRGLRPRWWPVRRGHRAALREQVAKALFNKGVTLGSSAAPTTSAVYDQVVARFGEATEPRCASRSPGRCSTRASALGELGRRDDEMQVYDEVVARFGEATEPALREQVARALVNKGVTLGQLGRAEDDGCGLRRGGGPLRRRPPSRAARTGRQGAGQQGRHAGRSWAARRTSAAYDEVVARFGEATEPALRAAGRQGAVQQGRHAGELGRPEEAAGSTTRWWPVRRGHRASAARAGRQGSAVEGRNQQRSRVTSSEACHQRDSFDLRAKSQPAQRAQQQ